MMSTLARAFSHDSGTFLFILDEMLRRGLISVSAAADWLTVQNSSPAKPQAKLSLIFLRKSINIDFIVDHILRVAIFFSS